MPAVVELVVTAVVLVVLCVVLVVVVLDEVVVELIVRVRAYTPATNTMIITTATTTIELVFMSTESAVETAI